MTSNTCDEGDRRWGEPPGFGQDLVTVDGQCLLLLLLLMVVVIVDVVIIVNVDVIVIVIVVIVDHGCYC